MITSFLTGNFGNNLFGIISSKCIAKELNLEWGVDPRPQYDYYNGRIQTDFLDIDYGKFPENITNEYTERCIRYNHDGDNTDIRTFDPGVYSIKDNTRLLGGVWQSPKYFLKHFDENWIKIKSETLNQTYECIKSNNINLENLCVINFRGGEYNNYARLSVRMKYYSDCMEIIKKENPNVKFIVITDDIAMATNLFRFPCYHFSIGVDYTLINLAKYLILSNSSFPIFSALTNKNCLKILVPKYWARHNVSTGYWATSQNIYPGFLYVDREGNIFDHVVCQAECDNWMRNNGYGEFV